MSLLKQRSTYNRQRQVQNLPPDLEPFQFLLLQWNLFRSKVYRALFRFLQVYLNRIDVIDEQAGLVGQPHLEEKIKRIKIIRIQ